MPGDPLFSYVFWGHFLKALTLLDPMLKRNYYEAFFTQVLVSYAQCDAISGEIMATATWIWVNRMLMSQCDPMGICI